jgi:hypothetical protein
MSTAQTGLAGVSDEFLRDAQRLHDVGRVAKATQTDFLEVPTPEEMAEARALLGDKASKLDVVKQARATRSGRPKGARNRRTDDFKRYLLSFGQHPGITMMQIQSTPTEVLIQASEQERVHSFSKNGEPRVVIERMTYEAATSLKIRCAEGLMPYFEPKKPVEVKLDAEGDFNLLIPGVNISAGDAQKAADGQFVLLDGVYTDVDAAEPDDGGEAGDA